MSDDELVGEPVGAPCHGSSCRCKHCTLTPADLAHVAALRARPILLKVEGARLELAKRQHVPYRIRTRCPACSTEVERDYTGDNHLSYAYAGSTNHVRFSHDCPKAQQSDGTTEWSVKVQVDVVLTLVDEKG